MSLQFFFVTMVKIEIIQQNDEVTIVNKKIAFITGSSRGIGKAIALAFASNGYRVAINASKSENELNQTKAEIQALGAECLSFLGDVSDYGTCKNIFEQIQSQWGHVDVLVNNAGISHIGLFSDMTPSEWERLLQVNLHSVLNCTHIATQSMVQNKAGAVINISSMWGNVGASCEAVYSASKGAIHAFTKAMAKELGPCNIRLNAIACGAIDTTMNQCFNEEEQQALCDEIPLSRFGTPSEVAELVLFLASEKSSYLTGQIITMDGGMN